MCFLPEVAMSASWTLGYPHFVSCEDRAPGAPLWVLDVSHLPEPPVLPLGESSSPVFDSCGSCWGGDRRRFGFIEAFVRQKQNEGPERGRGKRSVVTQEGREASQTPFNIQGGCPAN